MAFSTNASCALGAPIAKLSGPPGDTDVTVYAWDARERLVKATNYAAYGGSAAQVVDYLYDVENRWIGENIDSN